MSDSLLERRPRLAYPFTILTSVNVVRLVAGEDFRYTLTAPDLQSWMPALLKRCVGKDTLSVLIADLSPAQRESAVLLMQQLYGERVLVEGSATDAHAAQKYQVLLEGEGALLSDLRTSALFPAAPTPTNGTVSRSLSIYCQDRLDYEAALNHSRRCRGARMPMLWASCGAMTRAYVSPLFLPDAGPCFGCLLRSFQRLSPAPEIYDALREHARQQQPIEPVDFPAEGLSILRGLVAWKVKQAELEQPSAGLYRLHVLERERFEVATQRVFADVFCPECNTKANVG